MCPPLPPPVRSARTKGFSVSGVVSEIFGSELIGDRCIVPLRLKQINAKHEAESALKGRAMKRKLAIGFRLLFWLIFLAIASRINLAKAEESPGVFVFKDPVCEESPQLTNIDTFLADVANLIYDAEVEYFRRYQSFRPCDSTYRCVFELGLNLPLEEALDFWVDVDWDPPFTRAFIHVTHPEAEANRLKIVRAPTTPPI